MTKKRSQSIKTDHELRQKLELVEKDSKMVMITTFHMFKKGSRNIEDIFETIQIEFSETQTTKCEKKNILLRINDRLDIGEEKIH